jgi:hypothetical protein
MHTAARNPASRRCQRDKRRGLRPPVAAVRADAAGGKEIEASVLRRLTIDLSLEDGGCPGGGPAARVG